MVPIAVLCRRQIFAHVLFLESQARDTHPKPLSPHASIRYQPSTAFVQDVDASSHKHDHRKIPRSCVDDLIARNCAISASYCFFCSHSFAPISGYRPEPSRPTNFLLNLRRGRKFLQKPITKLRNEFLRDCLVVRTGGRFAGTGAHVGHIRTLQINLGSRDIGDATQQRPRKHYEAASAPETASHRRRSPTNSCRCCLCRRMATPLITKALITKHLCLFFLFYTTVCKSFGLLKLHSCAARMAERVRPPHVQMKKKHLLSRVHARMQRIFATCRVAKVFFFTRPARCSETPTPTDVHGQVAQRAGKQADETLGVLPP